MTLLHALAMYAAQIFTLHGAAMPSFTQSLVQLGNKPDPTVVEYASLTRFLP